MASERTAAEVIEDAILDNTNHNGIQCGEGADGRNPTSIPETVAAISRALDTAGFMKLEPGAWVNLDDPKVREYMKEILWSALAGACVDERFRAAFPDFTSSALLDALRRLVAEAVSDRG